ncbi:hypothetical protein JCM11491_000499 [Sporobolomyces phaffii]
MRITVTTVLGIALVSHVGLAQRTIVVENRCDYTVFPAISAFPDNEQAYTGEPGWEAPAGKKHTITVPSTWAGRIWARRGCMTNSDGLLVCVAGGCAGGLDCGESVLGESTALELRLKSSTNGQYDVYDLQNGGGWSVPTRVKPEAKGCSPVECVPDLDGCPKEEMKLKDSYGVVLGCASACFAHVGDTNVQCCTGEFGDPKVCTPEQIVGYEYFKAPCKNSYAYFVSSSALVMSTQSLTQGEPGFTLTFCPGGDGGKGSSNSGDSSGKSKSDGQPTGTAQAKPTDIPALTSAISIEGPASANSTDSATDAGGANPGSTAASTAATASETTTSSSPISKEGVSSSPSSSSSSESDDDTSAASSAMDGTILGVKTPIFLGAVGAVVLVGILAIVGVCICMRKGRLRNTQARGGYASDEATRPALASRGQNENPAPGHIR